MAEQAYPFDAGSGASTNEAQWQAMARNFAGTGVIDGRLNELVVSADGSGMTVSVATGDAFLEGFFYRSDAVKALTIATANATSPRIDTVVVRLDRTANTAALAVVTGTAASVPASPALTQTDALYELPLANIAVPAAAGVIAAGGVTDRRVFAATAAAAGAHIADESQHVDIRTGAQITGAEVGMFTPMLQAASTVVTTNVNGDASVSFPTGFPNGLVTVVAVVGDGNDEAALTFSGTSLFAFNLRINNASGTALANTAVRVNWIAVGH